MTTRLFVVERYDATGTRDRVQPLAVPPADAQLVCAVHIPVDDVVLALFEGTDEHAVGAALRNVGWRVDRITTATWVHPDKGGDS